MRNNVNQNCLICSNRTVIVLADFEKWLSYADNFSDARKNYSAAMRNNPRLMPEMFVKCSACGFICVMPMPDRDALTQFYQGNTSTQGYAKKERSKLRRADGRVRQLKKYVTSGSFIDIGCNLGFTVETARRLGYNASGLEVDADTIALAKNRFPENEFITGSVVNLAESGRVFDVVYCADVIEHDPDVRSFVASLARITRPEGILFLGTPDAGHWRVPRDFLQWDEVKPPQHLCWFTRKSLEVLLRDTGFTIISFIFNLKPGLKVIARKSCL